MDKSVIIIEQAEHLKMSQLWEPYRDPRPIRSAGRTSLPTAFSDYMALNLGISPAEIASAFDDHGNTDDRENIEREVHFLAGVFLDGRIRTYARLMGGGDPVELSSLAWEIDDPILRFAKGSLNLERPHDLLAEDTHWIFVDNEEWEAAMAGLRDDRLDPHDALHVADVVPEEEERPVDSAGDANAVANVSQNKGQQGENLAWRSEILTLDGVINVTGLKKSTIYTKIAAGSFPMQITLHGSRKGWRRGDVQDWLEELPSKG